MAGPKIDDWLPIIRRRAAALVKACDSINAAVARGASEGDVAQFAHQGYEALARLDETVPGGFREGLSPTLRSELNRVIADTISSGLRAQHRDR